MTEGFVDKNNTMSSKTLPTLARAGKWEEVEALVVEHGVDPDQKTSEWSSDHEMRALQLAAYYGVAGLAKTLVSHGADIHRKVDERYTALHYAVFFKHYDTVDALISCGADPLMPDDEGNTPIGRASEVSDVRMIDLLSKHGDRPATRETVN